MDGIFFFIPVESLDADRFIEELNEDAVERLFFSSVCKGGNFCSPVLETEGGLLVTDAGRLWFESEDN